MNGRALERAHPPGHEAPDATRPNTPAVHEGRHPRLWVIRCTGPADQRPLPERLPSIPSTESAREQDPSNNLFHEPEAQPKCVTAGALSQPTLRDHPHSTSGYSYRYKPLMELVGDADGWLRHHSTAAARWSSHPRRGGSASTTTVAICGVRLRRTYRRRVRLVEEVRSAGSLIRNEVA